MRKEKRSLKTEIIDLYNFRIDEFEKNAEALT